MQGEVGQPRLLGPTNPVSSNHKTLLRIYSACRCYAARGWYTIWLNTWELRQNKKRKFVPHQALALYHHRREQTTFHSTRPPRSRLQTQPIGRAANRGPSFPGMREFHSCAPPLQSGPLSSLGRSPATQAKPKRDRLCMWPVTCSWEPVVSTQKAKPSPKQLPPF